MGIVNINNNKQNIECDTVVINQDSITMYDLHNHTVKVIKLNRHSVLKVSTDKFKCTRAVINGNVTIFGKIGQAKTPYDIICNGRINKVSTSNLIYTDLTTELPGIQDNTDVQFIRISGYLELLEIDTDSINNLIRSYITIRGDVSYFEAKGTINCKGNIGVGIANFIFTNHGHISNR